MLVACAEGKTPATHLFKTEEGKPHWRDWIIGNVHRVCDLAKVPRVTAHAIRGLLATLTAERGLAGHLIAATLGHEDEKTTMTAYAAPGSAAAGANRRGLVLLQGGQDLSAVIDAALVLLASDGDRIITSDPDDLAPLARAADLDVELVRP